MCLHASCPIGPSNAASSSDNRIQKQLVYISTVTSSTPRLPSGPPPITHATAVSTAGHNPGLDHCRVSTLLSLYPHPNAHHPPPSPFEKRDSSQAQSSHDTEHSCCHLLQHCCNATPLQRKPWSLSSPNAHPFPPLELRKESIMLVM
jgi:hypothetical protein